MIKYKSKLKSRRGIVDPEHATRYTHTGYATLKRLTWKQTLIFVRIRTVYRKMGTQRTKIYKNLSVVFPGCYSPLLLVGKYTYSHLSHTNRLKLISVHPVVPESSETLLYITAGAKSSIRVSWKVSAWNPNEAHSNCNKNGPYSRIIIRLFASRINHYYTTI